MRIARFPDWQTRLAGALRERNDLPFEWGGHDCSISICDVLRLISNIPDPGEPWRGRYKTRGGAYRSLKAYVRRRVDSMGFDHWVCKPAPDDIAPDEILRWAATARALELGVTAVQPIKAQRGDPVVVRARVEPMGAESDCMGIIGLGSETLVAGAIGWTEVSADRIVAAWRLP